MKPRKTYQQMIASNKRNSVILMALMCVLLVGLGALFGGAYGNFRFGLLIAGITSALVLLFAWFAGSGTLLALSGAQEIKKADHPQLFNVVEEMSIAAGIPMPRVFIIHTDAPNAFATGATPSHSAVAITTGLLDKLSREELQGVMAHEIGHIRNFDIRYTMLMAIMAGAIVLLSDVFLRTTFWTGGGRRRSSNKDSGGIQAALMIIGIILAILAPLLTALIKLALSREREYLADASAVEFTRNPNGLASALDKLAADKTPMEASQAVAPLYIVNPKLGLRGGGDNLLSTHPPIAKRIQRLRELQGA